MKIKCLITLAIVFIYVTQVIAQSSASIREFDTTFLTYPFSDANPIPRTGKIYPYFNFDGYSTNPSPQSWKMVEMENEYIRVQITPEIGGKIWAAYDKSRNEAFIYANDVVKFRNIAMRGPWTSGGIEFNFGIIGHTPTVSTPIDYLLKENNDGSVSCFISALDLLTRTRWTVEINLPADKAYFSTRVYWVNSTELEQPYYTWMNLAVPAKEDLYFINPGTHFISHGGVSYPWPIDTIRDIDLSLYNNNSFEGSKSYHITGKHSDFFGTYYHDSDQGMIHLADRDDKIGKKVFLWALSDAGKIWETLLTDEAGQYVEVQSGRLFNQNVFDSSKTPFKQIGFPPQQTDQWTEYWFPYHGIGKADFVDRRGVWHFETDNRVLGIDFMSLTTINDTMKIFGEHGLIAEKPLESKPLVPSYLAFHLNPDNITKITFGETQIIPDWIKSRDLSRPLSTPIGFDQSESYNQYMLGHDAARFRLYEQAEKHIQNSLSLDSFFIPSLTEKSMLQYRKMHYDSAFYYARKALSINTYDPKANYYYGLAANQLGQTYDALDGWEVAALSPSWRIAAWYQIAAVWFRDENWSNCQDYLNKILEIQPDHPGTLEMQIVLNRIVGKNFGRDLIEGVLTKDPGNQIVAYEKYLRSNKISDLESFKSVIKNELPDQTYLELAIWYAINLNRTKEAVQLLEMAQQNNLIDYWLAYLKRNSNDAPNNLLSKADEGIATFIFPFRRESLPILNWAASETNDWKPKYYLALLLAHTGNVEMTKDILLDLPPNIDFAPLYSWRSYFQGDLSNKEKDLRKALSLEPENWRYVLNLAEFLMKNDLLNEAQHLLAPFFKNHPSNYQIGMALSRLYILAGEPHHADEILSHIMVLPYEGASEGRIMYQSAKLLQALNAIEKGKYGTAGKFVEKSRLWPVHLGVGKPYDTEINTDWEDRITSWIQDGQYGKNIPETDIKVLRDQILHRFFRFEEKAPF